MQRARGLRTARYERVQPIDCRVLCTRQVGRSDASNDCIHYYETDNFVGGPVMRMVSMALLNVICLR
jgi:hypothetical protein